MASSDQTTRRGVIENCRGKVPSAIFLYRVDRDRVVRACTCFKDKNELINSSVFMNPSGFCLRKTRLCLGLVVLSRC